MPGSGQSVELLSAHVKARVSPNGNSTAEKHPLSCQWRATSSCVSTGRQNISCSGRLAALPDHDGLDDFECLLTVCGLLAKSVRSPHIQHLARRLLHGFPKQRCHARYRCQQRLWTTAATIAHLSAGTLRQRSCLRGCAESRPQLQCTSRLRV